MIEVIFALKKYIFLIKILDYYIIKIIRFSEGVGDKIYQGEGPNFFSEGDNPL